MEKGIKELDNINSNDIISPCLSQSKSYLKILRVLYYSDNIFSLVTYNQIEEVIKKTYLFNNIVLTSQSHIIKASPKFDMTVIWVNIWDLKNGIKAKSLINRCFNIGYHIAIILGTNISPGISQ